MSDLAAIDGSSQIAVGSSRNSAEYDLEALWKNLLCEASHLRVQILKVLLTSSLENLQLCLQSDCSLFAVRSEIRSFSSWISTLRIRLLLESETKLSLMSEIKLLLSLARRLVRQKAG